MAGICESVYFLTGQPTRPPGVWVSAFMAPVQAVIFRRTVD